MESLKDPLAIVTSEHQISRGIWIFICFCCVFFLCPVPWNAYTCLKLISKIQNFLFNKSTFLKLTSVCYFPLQKCLFFFAHFLLIVFFLCGTGAFSSHWNGLVGWEYLTQIKIFFLRSKPYLNDQSRFFSTRNFSKHADKEIQPLVDCFAETCLECFISGFLWVVPTFIYGKLCACLIKNSINLIQEIGGSRL